MHCFAYISSYLTESYDDDDDDDGIQSQELAVGLEGGLFLYGNNIYSFIRICSKLSSLFSAICH